MSSYNLRKATNAKQRDDSMRDLRIITAWRLERQLKYISPKTQSLKSIENAVAMSINGIVAKDLPDLVRGISFYQSILSEIDEQQ